MVRTATDNPNATAQLIETAKVKAPETKQTPPEPKTKTAGENKEAEKQKPTATTKAEKSLEHQNAQEVKEKQATAKDAAQEAAEEMGKLVVPINEALGPKFMVARNQLIEAALEFPDEHAKGFIEFCDKTVAAIKAPGKTTQAELTQEITNFLEICKSKKKPSLQELKTIFGASPKTGLSATAKTLLHRYLKTIYVAKQEGINQNLSTGITTLEAKGKTEKRDHLGTLQDTLARLEQDPELNKNSKNQKDFAKGYKAMTQRINAAIQSFHKGDIHQELFELRVENILKDYSSDHIALMRKSVQVTADGKSENILGSAKRFIEGLTKLGKTVAKFSLVLPAISTAYQILTGRRGLLEGLQSLSSTILPALIYNNQQ